jgi:hypothetical protein
MQATYTLKPFPFQFFAFVCGVLAAAIIGGLGGYWLKSLDNHASSTAAAAVTTVRIPSMVGENAGQPAAVGGQDAVDRLLAAQASQVTVSATQSASSLYEQGGRPTAVYSGAAAVTTSMIGENARQDVVINRTVECPCNVGLAGTDQTTTERLHEGHRR